MSHEDYHSQLKTIVVENIIPLNTSIVKRDEVDTFNNWFGSDTNYKDDSNRIELDLGECEFEVESSSLESDASDIEI